MSSRKTTTFENRNEIEKQQLDARLEERLVSIENEIRARAANPLGVFSTCKSLNGILNFSEEGYQCMASSRSGLEKRPELKKRYVALGEQVSEINRRADGRLMGDLQARINQLARSLEKAEAELSLMAGQWTTALSEKEDLEAQLAAASNDLAIEQRNREKAERLNLELRRERDEFKRKLASKNITLVSE